MFRVPAWVNIYDEISILNHEAPLNHSISSDLDITESISWISQIFLIFHMSVRWILVRVHMAIKNTVVVHKLPVDLIFYLFFVVIVYWLFVSDFLCFNKNASCFLCVFHTVCRVSFTYIFKLSAIILLNNPQYFFHTKITITSLTDLLLLLSLSWGFCFCLS